MRATANFCYSQRAGCVLLSFGCDGRRVAERLRSAVMTI